MKNVSEIIKQLKTIQAQASILNKDMVSKLKRVPTPTLKVKLNDQSCIIKVFSLNQLFFKDNSPPPGAYD